MDYLNRLIDEQMHGLGWPAEAMAQLLLAAVAGGLVGMERELRGRQAGFRTNLLVCVGSALVMIVSSRMAYHPWPTHGEGMAVQISVDPARIAYGVMTGVGFLGAGTIIQRRGSVRGLTTAAGLWCVAAMGLAAGMGHYVLLMFTVLLLLVVLWLLDRLERFLPRVHYRQVTLRRPWVPHAVRDTIQLLKSAGLEVVDASYERTADLAEVSIHLNIAFMEKQAFYDFEQHLQNDQTHQLVSVRT